MLDEGLYRLLEEAFVVCGSPSHGGGGVDRREKKSLVIFQKNTFIVFEI